MKEIKGSISNNKNTKKDESSSYEIPLQFHYLPTTSASHVENAKAVKSKDKKEQMMTTRLTRTNCSGSEVAITVERRACEENVKCEGHGQLKSTGEPYVVLENASQ